MKANIIQPEPHLTVIKNNRKRKTVAVNTSKIYINTLIPGFNYSNSKGETIIPHNCILL
jgi:hypothetical protein